MARAKLKRFKENIHRENILEDNKSLYAEVKGNWNIRYFKNNLPITVEMGCGKGEYTIGLAKVFSDRNFIGVDVKGDRLWVGSTMALQENLKQVAFLRAQIQNIHEFFGVNEVDTVWITFPDPRPKKRDIKRRLTSPRFLELYKDMLKPDGMVYFKTDNTKLFEYSLEVLRERSDIKDLHYTFDLYNSEYLEDHFGIKTNFEQKYLDLGEKIKYLKFRFIQ